MKPLLCTLTVALLMALSLATGCSKKVNVDTVKLEYSVQTADPKVQAAVTEAIEAIDKADTTTALAKLKAAAADPKLTSEQKTALNDVIAQLQK